MDGVDFEIKGAAELEKKLRELPLRAARKILREEASDAVNPFANEMRAIVRRGRHRRASGQVDFDVIADNIVINTIVRGDLSVSVRVGPARETKDGYRLFWVRFLEFTGRRAGVSAHGRHYSAMPLYPFMRPAFEIEKQTVLFRFIQGVKRALQSVGLPVSP